MRAVPLALAIGMAMLVAVVALVSGSGPVRRWREGVVLAPKEEAFQQADAKKATTKPGFYNKVLRALSWSSCKPLKANRDLAYCNTYMDKLCFGKPGATDDRGNCTDVAQKRLNTLLNNQSLGVFTGITKYNMGKYLNKTGYQFAVTDVNGLPYKLQ